MRSEPAEGAGGGLPDGTPAAAGAGAPSRASDGGRPPEVALVAAFVDTVDVGAHQEHLPDPAALGAWCAERGLLPADAAVGRRDLARAIELRTALRELLRINAGTPVSPEAVVAANAALAQIPLVIAVDAACDPVLRPAGTGVDAALGAIVAGVVLAQAHGTWVRLKICDNESCQCAFYDHSKNRSGRWCSMRVCGNRAKTRTYRSRRRA